MPFQERPGAHHPDALSRWERASDTGPVFCSHPRPGEERGTGIEGVMAEADEPNTTPSKSPTYQEPLPPLSPDPAVLLVSLVFLPLLVHNVYLGSQPGDYDGKPHRHGGRVDRRSPERVTWRS